VKTKTYKILGATLALITVLSLAGAFMPTNSVEAVGAGTTPNQWQMVNTPGGGPPWKITGVGTTVSWLAAASDGKTFYAVDAATNSMYKSAIPGGWAWNLLVLPAGLVPPVRLVAVAPDNPDVIAIVDSTPSVAPFAAGAVFLSNNGGATWSSGFPVGNAALPATGAMTTSIAVGPARPGTILGRDFFATTANPGGGVILGGDVWAMGLGAVTWTSLSQTLWGVNTYDFTSVAVGPGYLGDRCITAVGSDNVVRAGDVGPAGDTFFMVIKTSDVPPAATLVLPGNVVALDVTATDSPADFGGGGIIVSSQALPADFDPTVTAGRRAFVSWKSFLGPGTGGNFDDVYRVDNTVVRKLETGVAPGALNGIWSIAFSGTTAGGTLVAGESGATGGRYVQTWVTKDPFSAAPSWAATAKSPTGQANCVVTIDPADATKIFAGTSGGEAAFSASENSGASFNQRGLIATGITALEDVAVIPNGATIFVATSHNAGLTLESLWKSATPTSSTTWERVDISAANWGDAPGQSLIRLSPDWADTPVLYWFDAAGPTNTIRRSVNGSDIFATRTAPTATVADITVENADILYLGDGPTTSVYVSTNGAWNFGLPVVTNIGGPLYDLEMAPSYPAKPVPGFVLVAGNFGTYSYSPSAAAFFIPGTGVPTGGFCSILADEGFADNDTIYAGDLAGGAIWRFVIDKSTTWENIHPLAAGQAPTGLQMNSGTLYASWTSAAGSGADRSLVPTIPVIAAWVWEVMNVGAPATATFNIVVTHSSHALPTARLTCMPLILSLLVVP